MSTYEAISLMIAFGMLIVALLAYFYLYYSIHPLFVKDDFYNNVM